MSYKTILVHLHDKRRAERLLEASIPLARAMSGHLIGLAVLPPFVTIPASEGIGTSVTVDEHRIAYASEMQALKELFTETAKRPDAAFEWREADAGFTTAAGTIIEHGRAADLIVIAQKAAAWGYSEMLEEPERITIGSGRPVLIVPNAGDITMPPQRVVVAWNGTREGTRAVFDALPLLQRAKDVTVLWIDPGKDKAAAGDLPGAELCTSLARHGVCCSAVSVTSDGGDVGRELLTQVKANRADLLVMGAYGHTRWREFFLGGASKHVFANMSCPVLMSH